MQLKNTYRYDTVHVLENRNYKLWLAYGTVINLIFVVDQAREQGKFVHNGHFSTHPSNLIRI